MKKLTFLFCVLALVLSEDGVMKIPADILEEAQENRDAQFDPFDDWYGGESPADWDD